LENIVYSDPKGKGDRKVIIIGYKDPEKGKIVPLIFQTSELFCGSSVEKVNSGKGSITHQLDVPIYARSKKRTLEFKNFLTKLNNKVMNDAKKYGQKWFSDTDELRYKSLIRGSNNKNKEFENGTIKLKFVDNDQFKTYVFDENKEPVDPEEYLKAGSCYMRIMMEVSALWISDGNYFGIATRVYQVGISRSSNPIMSTDTYAFIEDSDEENYDEFVADTEMEPVDKQMDKQMDGGKKLSERLSSNDEASEEEERDTEVSMALASSEEERNTRTRESDDEKRESDDEEVSDDERDTRNTRTRESDDEDEDEDEDADEDERDTRNTRTRESELSDNSENNEEEKEKIDLSDKIGGDISDEEGDILDDIVKDTEVVDTKEAKDKMIETSDSEELSGSEEEGATDAINEVKAMRQERNKELDMSRGASGDMSDDNSDDKSNIEESIKNMDPEKLEKMKKVMTELNMTEDDYPNIATENMFSS
jgi:hypothetical protein